MMSIVNKNRFLKIFLQEWKMFKSNKNIIEKGSCSDKEKIRTLFDSAVHAGEIRLFADTETPILGLVYKNWGESWIVIPLSTFTVPATEREILLGKRVYQLWNTFTTTNEFVERSWFVDRIDRGDMTDLEKMLLHITIGDPIPEDLDSCTGCEIILLSDPRVEYEMVSTVDFSPKSVVDNQTKNEMLVKSHLDLWLKSEHVEDYRLAAASEGDSVEMLCVTYATQKNLKDFCMNCELQNNFRSIVPGDDDYGLKFRIKGKHSFKWASSNDVIPVEVRRRDSEEYELVGRGSLDQSTLEVSVTIDADHITKAIENLSQIILVVGA